MNQFSLKNITRKYHNNLWFIFVLSIIETGLFITQFYFLGIAINDLLENSWQGIYILLGLFSLKMLVSYIKQIIISKSYNKIYSELTEKTIGTPLSQGENIRKLQSRSLLVHEMTEFIKNDWVKGIETILRLILVLVVILILNTTIFLGAITISFFIAFLYFFNKKKSQSYNYSLLKEFNKEHSVLQQKDVKKLYEFHHKIDYWNSKLMGISAINLIIIEILTFCFLIFSIIILVDQQGTDAFGTFFAMLYYTMAFSESLFLLPSLYQKYLKIQQVGLILSE